ncbi:MAG: hypothetical protein L6R39_007812 [Caloplaca ligustica]|nr:MAG: hypothetical protein L6R39_007812 [Caloplaca ligustica]
MSYLSFLQRLCHNHDHEQRLVTCSSILKSLVKKRLEDEFNDSSIVKDLYTFLTGSSFVGSSENYETYRALIQATNIPESSLVLFNHASRTDKRADELRARIAGYEKRIRAAWGYGAYEILPVERYNPTRMLSKHCMEVLCKLAEATDMSTGTLAILGAIDDSVSSHLDLCHLKAALKPYAPANGYPRGRKPVGFVASAATAYPALSGQHIRALEDTPSVSTPAEAPIPEQPPWSPPTAQSPENRSIDATNLPDFAAPSTHRSPPHHATRQHDSTTPPDLSTHENDCAAPTPTQSDTVPTAPPIEPQSAAMTSPDASPPSRTSPGTSRLAAVQVKTRALRYSTRASSAIRAGVQGAWGASAQDANAVAGVSGGDSLGNRTQGLDTTKVAIRRKGRGRRAVKAQTDAAAKATTPVAEELDDAGTVPRAASIPANPATEGNGTSSVAGDTWPAVGVLHSP